jgi:hypothetical protein
MEPHPDSVLPRRKSFGKSPEILREVSGGRARSEGRRRGDRGEVRLGGAPCERAPPASRRRVKDNVQNPARKERKELVRPPGIGAELPDLPSYPASVKS